MSDIEDYIREIVDGAAIVVPGWAMEYLRQLLVILLEEEIVVRHVLSSVVYSPGPNDIGSFTIVVSCLDNVGEYTATATWRYNHTMAHTPISDHWELRQEIELEEVR